MKKAAESILLFLTLGFSNLTLGQADIKLSSFFLSPLNYNPAYAGSYDGFTASSIYSSQWVGFDGAPNTLFLNAHSALKGTKTGVGIEIVHDKIGVTTQTQILANFAYHLKITRGWELSMGIKAGTNKYMVDYNQLRIDDPTELNVLSGELNQNGFSFGTGFFVHNEEFFFGVGVPDLLENNYYDFVFA
jgi:type IX secretion system PorP/SprF family membrane protein